MEVLDCALYAWNLVDIVMGCAGSLFNISMCSCTDSDEGKVYREFMDSCHVVPLRMRVCMLRSVTWSWSGISHNIVHGDRHPLRTAFSDTVVLAVCTS